MRKLIQSIFLLGLVVGYSGCIPFERRLAVMHLDKQSHAFNLAKGNETGKLLLSCSPPGSQVIDNYVIEIDNNEPITVYKYCDVEFILDTGLHTIKIHALEDNFGKETRENIEITKGSVSQYEYIGPYWMWSSGNLKEINEN